MEERMAPRGVDPATPNVARMYDYVLGGRDNFAADRAASDRLINAIPDGREALRANRRFLGRAVRYVAQQGVRQFIDLGSGLPNMGNVHEVAREVDPGARVVYVDIDPVVVVHARALLSAADDRATVIQADLRRPGGVLSDPEVERLIDFSQPVGVLFVATLHFVTDDHDPAGIVRAFTDRMVSGSHLVISHSTFDDRPEDQVAEIVDTYSGASAPMIFRGRDEIIPFFGGLDLVEPGLVKINRWRPDDLEARATGGAWVYGGVGRKA
jgi:hypothetical protein